MRREFFKTGSLDASNEVGTSMSERTHPPDVARPPHIFSQASPASLAKPLAGFCCAGVVGAAVGRGRARFHRPEK